MSVYVGIDVHRKRSQVAAVTEDGAVELNKNVVNGSEPMPRLMWVAIEHAGSVCGRSLNRSAPSPPSCQALRHRRTEPAVTRKSCAISLILSP